MTSKRYLEGMSAAALDDDTPHRFRFMPALGVLSWALMHAGVALALLACDVSARTRTLQQFASVTLDLPTPRTAADAGVASTGRGAER